MECRLGAPKESVDDHPRDLPKFHLLASTPQGKHSRVIPGRPYRAPSLVFASQLHLGEALKHPFEELLRARDVPLAPTNLVEDIPHALLVLAGFGVSLLYELHGAG